jgi:cell division protein FtsL
MSQRGQEAWSLDTQSVETEQTRTGRRSFNVVEGEGLDARARQGVSRQTFNLARTALIVTLAIFVVSVIRVGITAATVSALDANAEIKTEVSAAQDLGNQLRIESSVLSNTNRITRIATQNYDMVYAGAGEKLVVSSSSANDGDVSQPVDGNAVSDSIA